MKVQFRGIVRDIKNWDTNQKGEPLAPEKVTSQILFLDRDSGGDVSLTYPAGHGLAVGQEVTVDAVVKPAIRNFRLTLYVQQPAKSAK
jgi:hypothetical protein